MNFKIDFNTPERQEEMKKWVEEYNLKHEKRCQTMQNIFTNMDYIKWLESFTENHPNFSNEDWLYFPEKISKKDNENVDNFELFFEGIEMYANGNYIYPVECDFGGYYNIKFNNNGYEIGVLSGQGTIFFCNRTPINTDLEYIDFNNIINNKKLDSTEVVKKDLDRLSNIVIELAKKGIPAEAIRETFEQAFEMTSKEEKIQKRVLSI